jgi:hypothetical protein
VIPVVVVVAPRDAFDLCWLSRLDLWRLSQSLLRPMVVFYLLLFQEEVEEPGAVADIPEVGTKV